MNGVISGNPRVIEYLRQRHLQGYRPGQDRDTQVIVAFTGDAMRAPRSIAAAMALEAYTGRTADIVAGNSSGSAVAANMVSGTLAQNARMFFAEPGVARLNDDPRFIERGLLTPTMHNRFLTGPVMGPGGSFALNARAMQNSGQELIVGVTDAATMRARHYSFAGADFANQRRLMDVIAASTHIPGVSGRLPTLDNRRVFDGAFSDPIPYARALERAIERGAQNVKLVLISSQHPKDMDDLNFAMKAIVSLAGSVAVGSADYRRKFYERYAYLKSLGESGSPLLNGNISHRLPSGRTINVEVATITPPAGTPKMDPMTNNGSALKAATVESFRWSSEALGNALGVSPRLRPSYDANRGVVRMQPEPQRTQAPYQHYGVHGSEPIAPRQGVRAQTVIVGQPRTGRVVGRQNPPAHGAPQVE